MLGPSVEMMRRQIAERQYPAERAALTGQLLHESRPAAIRALVERGADVDAGALVAAAAADDVERTRTLLALNANPRADADESPLHAAARAGSVDESPLHAAARAGSVSCVRALRQHGADAREPDALGRRPSDVAAAAWRRARQRRRRAGHPPDEDDDEERRFRDVLRTLPAGPMRGTRHVGRRCRGLTLKGRRCLITSCARLRNAAPLRHGERFCALHSCQASDFPEDEVAPARPQPRTQELTAAQTLELLSTLAGAASGQRGNVAVARPAASPDDIGQLRAQQVSIEQRIEQATQQVRELQELGRVVRAT
jgi:hypothetical protein